MTSNHNNQADLVIRNGMIADGLGSPLFPGDVAITGGRITAVGKFDLEGKEEIDAMGALVTPGFVDVHTHYDGQSVWSNRFAPSSSHGVTTVLMGNCGVGFAPCHTKDHELLLHVMEGVEDIPEAVMAEGLDWSWETFPEFLDAIDKRPHDIDFATYLPHSPLRVYVMGERGADREPATPDDLEKMQQILREALDAGALGFSTSTAAAHRTSTGAQIPTFHVLESEYHAMAEAMQQAGRGIFQMVLEQRLPANAPTFIPMLRRISENSGRMVTFSMTQMNNFEPTAYQDVLAAISEANNVKGIKIQPQIYPRPIGMILGHDLSLNPFSLCPSYQQLASLPFAERIAQLRIPAVREKLLHELPDDPKYPLFVIARQWDLLFPLRSAADYESSPDSSIAAISRRTGQPPEEIAYDLLMERDGNGLILAALTNYAQGSLDAVLEMIEHKDSIVGLGDGGAHYGLICDASFTTFMLTHWTRDRKGKKLSLPDAVREITSKPAGLIGLLDRGVIAPGYKADINIIDYDGLTLELPQVVYDLPNHGRRLDQTAKGYLATIVSGVVIQRDGTPNGNLPGRLVRGAKLAPAA